MLLCASSTDINKYSKKPRVAFLFPSDRSHRMLGVTQLLGQCLKCIVLPQVSRTINHLPMAIFLHRKVCFDRILESHEPVFITVEAKLCRLRPLPSSP